MKERKCKFGFAGMNDMSIRTIDECFYQIRNGANIKQGTVEGGYPITRIETTANDRFNRDRMGYAGITDIEKYESYILQDGDLLMSHINSVQYLGRTVLYEKQGNEKIIHGMNLLGLKARRDIIIPAYARYCFYSYSFRQQIGRITKKSVNQASFAVADLKKIKIKVPDLSEQSRVVDILNRLNQVIEDRQQELQKLDDLTKARFVEMFGDVEILVNRWKAKAFSEVTINFDSTRKPVKEADRKRIQGEYPYYGATGIVDYVNDYKIDGTYLLISEDGKALEFRNRDIAFIAKGKIWVNNHAHVLQCTSDMNMIFLMYYMNFRNISDWVTGIDQKKLNRANMDKIPVGVPPIELQNQFVDFVHQVDKSKVVVQKALDEAQLLFDSLMQEYFG